jgi:hypothetical protein
VLVDELVHARLRERGLVGLVVPVPPVAEQVDDDVLVERLPELEGEPHHPHRRLGVVPVHVEDRRLHHLGHVGRVDGRPARRGRGGEADLVVDDEVDGAADVVPRHLGEVERLRDHALPGEGGVTVQEDGQHVEPALVAELVLLGARHPLDDRVDRLEVARVRRQAHHDLVAGG